MINNVDVTLTRATLDGGESFIIIKEKIRWWIGDKYWMNFLILLKSRANK